jgi:hypothetical protein
MIHACEVYAREVHAYGVHANEVHAYVRYTPTRYTLMRCMPIEVHAHEVIPLKESRIKSQDAPESLNHSTCEMSALFCHVEPHFHTVAAFFRQELLQLKFIMNVGKSQSRSSQSSDI